MAHPPREPGRLPPRITGSAHSRSWRWCSSRSASPASAGGGSFVDDFRTPGHGIAERDRPAATSASRPRRAIPRTSSSRSSRARCASPSAGPRSSGRSTTIAAQPHVTRRAEPVRQEQSPALRATGASPSCRSSTTRTAADAGQGAGRAARAGVRDRRARRRRGRRATAQVVDQAEQQHRPGRRADRRRGGDDRAHARVPLGGRDGADAGLGADRPRRRHAAAARSPARFADFPSFAPTLGVMLGLGAGHRLRAADRRPLSRAAGGRRRRRATPRAWRTPPPARRWSPRARSSWWRSPACWPPASRSSGAWASARRSSSPRSPSARSPCCPR